VCRHGIRAPGGQEVSRLARRTDHEMRGVGLRAVLRTIYGKRGSGSAPKVLSEG
jgi:hypothetical protein